MINNSTLIHDVAPDELTENIRSVIREELSLKGSRIGTRVLYSEEDIKEALKEIAEQKYKRR